LSSDEPVIDRTGLTGEFDLDLDMSRIIEEASQGAAGPDEIIGRLFEATANALQDELGLKLAPTKAPVEILVIDHAEKASAN
jgi:uncharacterized protein (TIGR03435 family)